MKMIRFLLRRPVAVCMLFSALCILGLVTYPGLSVSLLPPVPIPEIVIQTAVPDKSAREIENMVVAPLRRQLLQTEGMKEIKSEVQDGNGKIRMKFNFGTNIDLAFIEVNEKIDAVAATFPKDIERPRVIKTGATDIPVMYVNLTLKNNEPYKSVDNNDFARLCDVARDIVSRRIEQLPEVSMTDISGIPNNELHVTPDMKITQPAGITPDDIISAIKSANVETGTMTVRDGYYEYSVHLANILTSQADIGNILLKKSGRVYRLGDICNIEMSPVSEKGRLLCDGKRAVSLAIIKNPEGRMDKLRSEIDNTLRRFAKQYPEIEFKVSRNQTELLDYTITSLQTNFVLSFILMFVVAVVFIGDIRTPIVTGVSMSVAIIMIFLLFFLFDFTLNIISLSGLVLVVGMMIDNMIIVTENISQHEQRGEHLIQACSAGTAEMITPMLSSSLTTIAVFLPLIFLSDIAGALFFDQALSISFGLLSSYIVAILLLPVVYMLFSKTGRFLSADNVCSRLSKGVSARMLAAYDKGIRFVFARKRLMIFLTFLTLPLCMLMYNIIRKEQLPETRHNDIIARIDWNSNVHIDENNKRINDITSMLDTDLQEHSASVGMQDYLLGNTAELTPSESELYIKAMCTDSMPSLQNKIKHYLTHKYPLASVSFSAPENIFDKLFSPSEAPIVVEMRNTGESGSPDAQELHHIQQIIERCAGVYLAPVPMQEQIELVADAGKLNLYGITANEISDKLTTSLKGRNATVLRSSQQYIPVRITSDTTDIGTFLTNTLINTGADGFIPLSEMVSTRQAQDIKRITAGKDGEYFPFDMNVTDNSLQTIEKIKSEFSPGRHPGWEAKLSGSYFSNINLMQDLAVVLAISILLMYFILCAQFESFLQPLIVLIEIPIDTAIALLVLWMCGYTLNLMSAIGIITSCGIIVNDSILKIDSINTLRKKGMPIAEAIHTVGHRRLRAIVMTSLTTVVAMFPFFMTNDMGSELQRPLAVAMISTITVGTLISLFVVPLIFSMVYNKKAKNF